MDRKQTLGALQQILRRTSNFKDLRIAIDLCKGPCLPYIGITSP
jgi:hypothetical protein